MKAPVAILVLSMLAGCGSPPPRGGSVVDDTRVPQPTEHVLDEGAEASNKAARRAWMEYIHKAAPGVDWQAIERENGRLEQERRNALAIASAAAPASGPSQPSWTEIGSNNLAGRMHCAVHSPDGTQLYAGSSLGGVWRGNLDGTDWQPLSDNLYGGAHELLVLPGENVGDPDVVITVTDGGSVHVTRDDGVTWETPTGVSLTNARGVAVLDDAASTILIYGRGSGSYAGSAVLFASTDYGETFAPIWQAGGNWRGWMWVPRVGSGAATDIYLLHQGVVYRSQNGGDSFTTLSTISTVVDRGVLTGSEAGAPTLYAAVRLDGTGDWELHRSDDGGQSWLLVHTYDDFWESLCASPLDPNRVVRGGVECFVSDDGGVSFDKVNNWWSYYSNPSIYLHADLPGIHCWLDPSNPSQDLWYISTDGGVYRSDDGLDTVENISLDGLGVSQYYSTLSSSNDWDIIAAGAQDQGYQRGVRTAPTGPGPSTPFDQIISGDYGHLTSSDGTHDLVYSTYPGFILVHIGEFNPSVYQVDFPTGSDSAWLPPVVADPLDSETFYFCGDQLYRYDRTGPTTWAYSVQTTQDLTTSGADYLTALAFAPTDPNRAYTVNDDGDLYYSDDHGVTWTPSVSSASGPHYFYGHTIAVHPTDPNEVVVGGSGYSSPGVRRSVDGGVTWQSLVTGLPNTMVYGLAYPDNGSGDLYAATQAGAYRWERETEVWINIMATEAPITTYWSVESVDDGETMRFGTYGRGIWDYAVPPPSAVFVRGDCGGDGSINIGDAITQLSALFDGLTIPCADSCDANDDGAFDIGDVPYLLDYIFLMGATPPAPFPTCGTDDTTDGLGCDAAVTCP